MTPKVLRTFVTIGETGSFARTAEALNMTLSAVSTQMKTFEDQLDASLFDRTHRPPQLTPLGRHVLDRARTILNLQNGLIADCRKPDVLKGDFRIGFVLTSSVRLLPGFLARAFTAFPHARFHVETGLSHELSVRVSSGRLDAAVITGGERLPNGLTSVVLTREELVYCLPKTAARWSIAEAMAKLAFFHFMPQAGIGRLIASHVADNDLKPQSVIVLDTVEAVAECVRAGVGFAILPRPDVLRYAQDDLVIRPLDHEPVYRELVLITPAKGVLDGVCDALSLALVGDHDSAQSDA